jgi:hypothetical protein
MALTRADKERIADSRLKIQSVADSLKKMDPKKIQDFEELQECLEDAERSLSGTLRSDS